MHFAYQTLKPGYGSALHMMLTGITLTEIFFIEGIFVLLQPLRWRCVECAIHHERDVREE